MRKTGAIEEVPMTIIGGLDLHRRQITFDYLNTNTGEVRTGQLRPATREAFRPWLAETFQGRDDVRLAVEGCTGWRFVVEEMQRAGVEPHLAEPADTATLRGRKNRAKTDKADARLLRDLLSQERLPESWIPPQHVMEVRTLVRLYVALMDERRGWQQRMQAQLYHQGVPPLRGLLTVEGRKAIEVAQLSPSGRQMVETALVTIAALDQQIEPLRAQLKSIGGRQPGARALMAIFGIGALCGVVIWAELGDCRRFRRSDQAVRFAGLDVTVWSTDGRPAGLVEPPGFAGAALGAV
jgi:transposase